jgi:hypothetical protein
MAKKKTCLSRKQDSYLLRWSNKQLHRPQWPLLQSPVPLMQWLLLQLLAMMKKSSFYYAKGYKLFVILKEKNIIRSRWYWRQINRNVSRIFSCIIWWMACTSTTLPTLIRIRIVTSRTLCIIILMGILKNRTPMKII